MNILILILLLGLSMGMKIDRDVSDTLHGFSHCAATGRAEGTFSCTCKPKYKTLMSSPGGEFDCRSLSEVGCEYSLQDNDQALLITEKNLVRPIYSGNITKNNLNMKKVLVWNYDGYHGTWNDITRETERLFKIDDTSGNSTLLISSLTLKAMAGHAVKITFKDTKCVVFKFKGTVEYGFDLDEFKKKFGVRPTRALIKTKPPSLTTTAKAATTSPVTEKKTTTVNPTTKGIMTKLPKTRPLTHPPPQTVTKLMTKLRTTRPLTRPFPQTVTKLMTKLRTTRPLTRPSPQTVTKRKTTVSPMSQPWHVKKIIQHLKMSFEFETKLEMETEH